MWCHVTEFGQGADVRAARQISSITDVTAFPGNPLALVFSRNRTNGEFYLFVRMIWLTIFGHCRSSFAFTPGRFHKAAKHRYIWLFNHLKLMARKMRMLRPAAHRQRVSDK